MNDKIRNLRFFAKTFFKHFARDVHFFFHENVSACERRTEVCALDLMNTVSSTRRGGKVCEPAVELWLVEPGPSTNNKKKKTEYRRARQRSTAWAHTQGPPRCVAQNSKK